MQMQPRALVLTFAVLSGLIVGSITPAPAERVDEVYTRAGFGDMLQGVIGVACRPLDAGLAAIKVSHGCERSAPILGQVAAFGACAVVFSEVLATPCIAGALAANGIGIGAAAIHGGCTSGADKLYDECITAGWSGLSTAVGHAKKNEATLQDAGFAALDLVGGALPIGGEAKLAQKGISEGAKTAFRFPGKAGWAAAKDAKGLGKIPAFIAADAPATSRAVLKQGGVTEAKAAKVLEKAKLAGFSGMTSGEALTAYGKQIPLKTRAGLKLGKATLRVGSSKGIVTATRVERFVSGYAAAGTAAVVDVTKSNTNAGGQDQDVPPGTTPVTDAGDTDGGESTVGEPGHEVTISVLSPNPAGTDTYSIGDTIAVSFRVHADAKMSGVSVWLGSRTPFWACDDCRGKIDESFRVVVSTHEAPLPAGHWTAVIVATDGLETNRVAVKFDVENADGAVPEVDQSKNPACNRDVNHNAMPDCIESAAVTVAAPVKGQINWFMMITGLAVLLGGGLVVWYNLRGD